MANDVKSNADEYINKLYDKVHDTHKEQLTNAYAANTEAIDTQQKNTQQQAQQYTDRANTEVQKVAQAYKPANVSNSVNAQVALATENQQKANTAAISNQQQVANAEYERLRKLYADQFTAAIKQAQADNDMARAQQLYEAAKAKEKDLKAFATQMGELDDEALINQIYDSAAESQRQQIASQQAQTMSELDAQRQEQMRQTDQNLTSTYVDALKKAKNYNEVQNAYGLGSGNMAQAQLARELGTAANLTELRRLQMANDAQLGAKRVEAQKSYADTLADAVRANEEARATAMYKEALTQEPRATSGGSGKVGGTGAYRGGTAESNAIAQRQQELRDLGYDVAVDGIDGPQTQAANYNAVLKDVKTAIANGYDDRTKVIIDAAKSEGYINTTQQKYLTGKYYEEAKGKSKGG